MSDWEIVQDNASQQQSQPQSDWEVVAPVANSMKRQQEESTGMSLLKAIPRVGEDLYRGAAKAIKAVPAYMDKAETEVPGVFSAIKNNPASAGKQALAGVAEMGQNVFNTPHDIVNYMANRLNLFPKYLNEKVQMGRMPDSLQEINSLLGTPQQPGEALIRGVGRNIESIIPGTKAVTSLAKTGVNAIRPINTEKVAKSIQNSHDTLHKSAVNDFKNVEKGAYNRNVSSVPLRKDLIADIADHPLMPTSEKIKSILDKAYSGDYSGLRDLQSELFQRGTKAVRSPLVSEANAGETLFDLRDEINNSIKNHLTNTGNHDLANMLSEGVSKYKLLKDTYYHKKTPGAIKNLVDPESRKIPNKLMDVMSQESRPMNRVKKENPFAANKTEQYKSKQKSIKNLKRAVWTIGTVGAASEVNKLLGGSHD